MKRMARFFRDALLAPPDGRLLQRSLVNSVLSISVSLALVWVVFGVTTLLGVAGAEDDAPEAGSLGIWPFVGIVLLVPVAETLMLAGLLRLLPQAWGIMPRALVSGLIWGGFHALFDPMWFFAPAFAFFVLSCAYLTWRPASFGHAFTAATLPHALQNLVAFVLYSLPG